MMSMLSGMCSLVMRDRSKLVSDQGLLVMIRVCSTVRGTGPTGRVSVSAVVIKPK